MKLKSEPRVLLILLILPSLAFVHPFYFSLTEVDHNAKTESLEITIKLFTGDIELALEAQGTGRLFLGEAEKEHEKADLYLQRYLQQHLQLTVNGEEVEYEFLGKEVEIDVLWCYAEVPNVAILENLTVKNTMLFEELDGQQNVVLVKSGKQKKSNLFIDGNAEQTFSFK